MIKCQIEMIIMRRDKRCQVTENSQPRGVFDMVEEKSK
jgi:hypothetical protein